MGINMRLYVEWLIIYRILNTVLESKLKKSEFIILYNYLVQKRSLEVKLFLFNHIKSILELTKMKRYKRPGYYLYYFSYLLQSFSCLSNNW